MPGLSSSKEFWQACVDGNLQDFSKTFSPSVINTTDLEGNTALHVASSNGHTEIVRLLLRYHANRTKQNERGLTAEDMAADDQIKKLFQLETRPASDSSYFEGTTNDIEWLDSYKNAYRIAHENHEHMRRWLLKVPLVKLLEEIDIGYLEELKFETDKCKQDIKEYIKYAIEYNDPLMLVTAYASPGTGFYTLLNYDLAKIGSDFRFLSTQNLFHSGYMDNEAPKGLGQHVFAAILINHPSFRDFKSHTGTSYRGMNVLPSELEQYQTGSIILTRSLLSTSTEEYVAKLFTPFQEEGKRPVMCIYILKKRASSLVPGFLSAIEAENEVLIFPFTVFQVNKREDVEIDIDSKNVLITRMTLEECS